MDIIKKLLRNKTAFVGPVLRRLSWMFPDDAFYLRMMYLAEMHKILHLDNPVTFTEKIQWLKLYNRKPEYTQMVDKHAVKKYVAEKIGDEYIIPTLGIWDKFDEINFDSLPNKFVLKTTHGGGGGVAICRDKATFDKASAKARLEKSLGSDIYKNFREWPYKNVPRRILAEKLLGSSVDMINTQIVNGGGHDKDIRDYKFFCFNGEPKFLKVDFGRFTDHHANYYDMQWNLLPFGEADLPPCPFSYREAT